MGRPPLDRDAKNTERRLVAFPKSLLKRVKTWANKHDVSLSSAIRTLVEQGLDKEGRTKK